MKNPTSVERKSDREVVITRLVNAPPHIVWKAWTSAGLFRRNGDTFSILIRYSALALGRGGPDGLNPDQAPRQPPPGRPRPGPRGPGTCPAGPTSSPRHRTARPRRARPGTRGRRPVRFLIDGVPVPPDAASYQRIVLMFDGEDDEAVAAARVRWTEAKAQGFEATYWQTDENGRWQRKA